MVGMRATESMRIEKTYRMWGMELTRDYSALEAGLDRFVALNKGDFTGRDALTRQREEGLPNKLVMLEVDADDTDAHGNEPIYLNGEMVGRATAGAFGHFVGKSLAIAYVHPKAAEIGTELEIEILKDVRKAKVIPESPHDPESTSLRADG